jgi:hypothetical protein
MAIGFFKVIGSTPPSPEPTPWVRPSDWLVMPEVLETDDTFVGLHAVIEDGDNFVAFRFTTSTGQYQVDWGDGTIDLVNSDVTAEHTYDYASYDTGNTTLSTRGYKQAIIVVTPVTGNLLTANFQFRRTTVPAQNVAYSTGFLDCILSMPNASSGQSITFGGITVLNSPSTIDTLYIGEVKVLLINLSNEEYTVNHGDRIAQGVIAPRVSTELGELIEVTEISETVRGENGFGSTGKR